MFDVIKYMVFVPAACIVTMIYVLLMLVAYVVTGVLQTLEFILDRMEAAQDTIENWMTK